MASRRSSLYYFSQLSTSASRQTVLFGFISSSELGVLSTGLKDWSGRSLYILMSAYFQLFPTTFILISRCLCALFVSRPNCLTIRKPLLFLVKYPPEMSNYSSLFITFGAPSPSSSSMQLPAMAIQKSSQSTSIALVSTGFVLSIRIFAVIYMQSQR